MKKVLLASLFAYSQIITTFPYFTGFEGRQGNLNDSLPDFWTYEDLNGAGNNSSWEIIKNSQLSVNAHTDSTAVHMFSNMNESNNDWLFTPGVQMEIGKKYTITFWYCVRSILSSFEKTKLHVGTGASSADMMTDPIWDNNHIINENYQMETVSYTPSQDGVFYFGFHSYSDPAQFIFFLDDITISSKVTGIAENDLAKIQLSPNPSSDFIHITGLNENQNYRVILYNMLGRKVQENPFNGTQFLLDISAFENGNYFVRILTENNEIITSRPISIVR